MFPNDNVKRIRIVMDNGEEIKITDPISLYEDDENGLLGVKYACTYYDAYGEHTVVKASVFNVDHILYCNFEYKEEI